MSDFTNTVVRPPLRVEEHDAVRAALAGAARRAPGEPPVSVTIGVSGGAPSERYLFMVRLNGAGEGQFRFLDEVTKREEPEVGFRVPAQDIARIFGLVEALVEPMGRELYDPDSLVGFVTVRAGKLESQTRFPVHEAGGGGPANTVALPATDDALRVDPQQVPDGLTSLFAEMTSLVERHV
jgi:hypothetical protein